MNDQRTIVIKGLFNLLALGAAAVAGFYAYDQTSSWWFVAFAVMMTLFAVGRAIPDVITEPDKGRRALFYGIPLAFAIGGLAASQAVWGTWWLSVLVGFGVGGVGWLVDAVFLPDITREEQEDSVARVAGEASQPPPPPLQEPTLDPQLVEVFRATTAVGITFTLEEEQEIVRAHAAGDDDEVARLIERKAAARTPVGAGR
jgi:hypothetical protein